MLETLILWGLFCKGNLSFLKNQILYDNLIFLVRPKISFSNVKKDKEEKLPYLFF